MGTHSDNVLINNYSIRCFRDTADKDYIHARLAFKAGLMPQFLWSSLHCLEKYFKCILLLNRVKSKNIKHDIVKALSRTISIEKLSFDISSECSDFIEHLNGMGKNRYLEEPYYTRDIDLVLLDKTVWEIRRYCKVLDYTIKKDDGELKNMLAYELKVIEKSNNKPPTKYRILGGYLEKVIDNETHPSRSGLLWQNAYFGKRIRNKVSIPGRFESVNDPATMDPKVVELVKDYVYVPKSS